MVGRPVRHSLSPVLHRAAYAALGLAWSYDAHEVGEDTLAGFLDGLDGTWRGLSLTMPLKRTVVPLVTELGTQARRARAVNTLVLREGHRAGHNTDVPGAAAAIRERYDGPVDRAVILGGGATAASTLLALADLGCEEVVLQVRDPSRAAETLAAAARHPAAPRVEVRRLGSGPAEADVLVSTIPALAHTPDVLALTEPVRAVFDVIYDPWPTPLSQHAERTGRVAISGLDLLVHQAVLQVELMTGRGPAPPAVMRAAGERALAARG